MITHYHKIQTVFKRDMANKGKTLLEGEYSLPEFEYLANNEWTWTEKVDGTNIRIIIEPTQRVVFQGKTDSSQIPAILVARLRAIFDPLEESGLLHEMFPTGACLCGEGYGPKIQKVGHLYRPDQDFVLFDVLVRNTEGQMFWLERGNVQDIGDKLKLMVVPIIGKGTLLEMVAQTKHGFTSTWGDFPAEGIVARPTTELFTRKGERIITKIKLKDFQG